VPEPPLDLGRAHALATKCLPFPVGALSDGQTTINYFQFYVAGLYLTSHKIESTTTRKLDPENIGVTVGILSLCVLELEICLGMGNFTSPLPANVAKKRNRKKG